MNDSLQRLKELALIGSEADITRFIKENWKDLPLSVQDEFSVACIIDALKENEAQNKSFEVFRESFVMALEQVAA
jgi:hypothetical protein